MKPVPIQRVQTGMRIEKRILKVLKALAEYLDMTLGDLIEGIVLHNFEGKQPFDGHLLKKIDAIKAIYDLDLTAAHSHKLTEASAPERPQP
ncbi:MAG: hypothetical protein QNJ22_10435 [Desulfosarcinaceae bacterium]|nr:hypothetical protein [Desulfosarcinaceae bacterium]